MDVLSAQILAFEHRIRRHKEEVIHLTCSVIFGLFLYQEREKAAALKPCSTKYDVGKAIKYILLTFHSVFLQLEN